MHKMRTVALPTLALLLMVASSTCAQTVATVAGGYVGDGNFALKAAFTYPYALVVDKNKNAYVTDLEAHRIRKIAPNGTVSTYAGTGISGFSGDGGPADAAMVSYPSRMEIDAIGNLIFSDNGNLRVRKIDASSVITTIAGNGSFGYSGDGGPATNASFEYPYGVASDRTGNVYISDFLACVIRKVNTKGVISTVVGNGTCEYGGDGGPAKQATLNWPADLAFDTRGNLYIADMLSLRVRKVDASGLITTIAGNGDCCFDGDGGPATDAAIGPVRWISYRAQTLYIAGSGTHVRAVTNGVINSIAGSTFGYDGDGHAPISSQFAFMSDAVQVSSQALVVVDRGNDRIREAVGNTVKTVAGGYLGDGRAATSASLINPENVAFDSHGNMYVADGEGNRVRKVGADGKITTVAGTGVTGYAGDGGQGLSAELNFPSGLVANSEGELFIADNLNRVVRKVNLDGSILTFATNPLFFNLQGMSKDANGNVYVADGSACVIWKIDATGQATVVAGNFVCGYNGDDILATDAELFAPYDVAFDTIGNFYIADTYGSRIRKVDTSGIISTLVGDGNCGYTGDNGPPQLAELCNPDGVAVFGNTIYIADTYNFVIRKIEGNVISTYAGSGFGGYNGNNIPALTANFDEPVSVAVDPAGRLYVADDRQNLVRRVH